MEDGMVDALKGSYYGNPLQDEGTPDEDLRRQYPSYCRSADSVMFESMHCLEIVQQK